MNLSYRPLFMLQISHGYCDPEPCYDLDWIIPESTAAHLRNGKLVARKVQNRMFVYYQVDTSTPQPNNGVWQAVAPWTGKTLCFGLRVVNPYFANVTELAHSPETEVLLWDNRTVGNLLGGPRVQHAFVPEMATPNDTRVPASAVVLEMRRTGLFAVVEVVVGESFYKKPVDFQLKFAEKQETLSYYIVAAHWDSIDVDQLSVNDGTSGSSHSIVFAKETTMDPNDPIHASLALPETQTLALFRSMAKVSRQRINQRSIQLQKNGEVIFAKLPRPGAKAVGSNIVVHVSKPPSN